MHKKYDHIIWMTAENPLQQIWTMIKSLCSLNVCIDMLKCKHGGGSQNDNEIKCKAQGISFLMQNACDYFEAATTKNLTQRLLNIYYGTIAFIEAEMLANDASYSNLDDIERITKHGHGLYLCADSINGVGEIGIGILGGGRGLFPAWLSSRGIDITLLPESKKSGQFIYAFKTLLAEIPELEQLMKNIDSNYIAGFFRPVYISDPSVNPLYGANKSRDGSYIALYDYSETTIIEDVKSLIGPFAFDEIELYPNIDEMKAYKVLVKHLPNEQWWSKINIHKSSFCDSTILKPLLFSIDDWEIYAVMILYGLSILVRYNPSIWRRIQHSDWDEYFAIFEQFAMVAERVIPNIFYEKITGNRINIKMPGSLGV